MIIILVICIYQENIFFKFRLILFVSNIEVIEKLIDRAGSLSLEWFQIEHIIFLNYFPQKLI